MYIMLNELNAQFRVSKHIYAIDLGIVTGFTILGVLMQNIVFSNLKIVCVVFNVLVGLFMTAPSFANPQKRNIQAIFIMLRRVQNKRVYSALPTEYSNKEALELRNSDLEKI